MKKEDAEEFTQSLEQIVTGAYRQTLLAEEIGVAKALGITKEEWANRLSSHVRFAANERKKLAGKLISEGFSRRAIGRALGVDAKTIRNDLADGEKSPPKNQPEESGTGASGEKSPPPQQRTPPPPDGPFSVILADPPWRYDFAETQSRRIENQYDTMELDGICELGESMPFADDAVLFMWATAPKLTEALRVVEAWSFNYVTHAIWDKEIIGMGYWFRGQHELLLVATRGDFPPPAESERVPSVIHGRRARHSEKPEAAYRMIEAAYPELTEAERLEMFARQKREGWTSWGNESALAA